VLSKGRAVASGTPSELAARQEFQSAYFGEQSTATSP
jgi:ABC-type branched-subunit amino acid transport system ATPase component